MEIIGKGDLSRGANLRQCKVEARFQVHKKKYFGIWIMASYSKQPINTSLRQPKLRGTKARLLPCSARLSYSLCQ